MTAGAARRRWAVKGVFERIFLALSDDPDFEYALIDGAIVKVHRHGAGAKKGIQNQAIGRSGLTTKIVALVDALGSVARFVLLPGHRHDSVGVEPLIEGVDFDALIGDKAFDSDALRATLNDRGATAVIPAKADRKRTIPSRRRDVQMASPDRYRPGMATLKTLWWGRRRSLTDS
jgi:transposase